MLRRGEDRQQLGRFLLQTRHSRLCDNACLNQTLQPEDGFVDLFHNDTDLGDKLGLGSCAARGAVIRRHGRPRPERLLSDNARFIPLR